jgi:hypothetical protein
MNIIYDCQKCDYVHVCKFKEEVINIKDKVIYSLNGAALLNAESVFKLHVVCPYYNA